ncbi:flavodoxin family protein [Leptospira sp. 96542]|nr:flavodoxin family protein [Leptospira sp. 96542]
MKKIAVIFHSGQGNTEQFAKHVVAGAQSVAGTEVGLLKAEDLTRDPDRLTAFDGCIFGSPTYLGGVSGPFKSFMDATGGLWRTQQLKGKLASGFTVSALPSGDKQTTLLSMFTFAMQHGMIWVGNPFLPEQNSGTPYEQALNRLGSWTGLMAQAGHSTPGQSYAPGDLRSAEAFGRNFASVLARMTMPTEEAI